LHTAPARALHDQSAAADASARWSGQLRTAYHRQCPGVTMKDVLKHAVEAVNQVLLGKPQAVQLAVACILARGHLLIEDLPGMGKTTLSQALARVMGLSYQRIQFTSDLLPGDILGTSVFDRDSGNFVFHPGPIFA